MNGFFITFEGMEGSGKSTQVGLLGSRLKEEGFDIVATREPGGTRIGELIRNITHGRENVDLTVVAEAYLMAAARAQLVREIIAPALKNGKIVIVDRFIDSSLAYQGYGRRLGVSIIEQLNKEAIKGLIPDLTIFLDVSPSVGFSRRNGTDKIDRLDLQQKDFYERVYDGYNKIIKKDKNRFLVIDSSQPIEKVAEEIWNIVEEKIKTLAK
jgi:dTMP kinase